MAIEMSLSRFIFVAPRPANGVPICLTNDEEPHQGEPISIIREDKSLAITAGQTLTDQRSPGSRFLRDHQFLDKKYFN